MAPAWKKRLDDLQISSLADIFRTPKPIIGMVHCWPLPGAPGYTGYGMQTIIDHAKADNNCKIIAGGQCDGSQGFFVRPTVIETTNPKYETMVEELFGPILTVFVYDFIIQN
jgi:hypothetical protein